MLGLDWKDVAMMVGMGPMAPLVPLAKQSLARGQQANAAAYGYNYQPQFDWTQAQQDYAAQEASRLGQMDAATQARLEAEGKLGPSLAQQQQAAGQQRAAQDAAQMAASARGGPAAVAAAQRQAQMAQANAQSQTAQQAGMLRSQEQQAAYQRELAALQGAGQLATAQRQGSMSMAGAEVDAQMQAERYRQEGAIGYDQAATAADQAYRDRQRKFWGKFIDTGAGIATKGATGGMG